MQKELTIDKSEQDYIRRNYHVKSDYQMGVALKLTKHKVYQNRNLMRLFRGECPPTFKKNKTEYFHHEDFKGLI